MVDEYNLTSLGFVTVNLKPGDLTEFGFEYVLEDMLILSATLRAKESSQFSTVYLVRDSESEELTYSATIPLHPGMTPGEWELVYISDYEFGMDRYSSWYYHPGDSAGKFMVTNVQWDPHPVEVIIDPNETILTRNSDNQLILSSRVFACDESGVDFLMGIFESPIGELVVVEYLPVDVSLGLWKAEMEVEWDGQWTLVGLLSKDGADNWVVPEVAFEAGLFPVLVHEWYVPHDSYPAGLNPDAYDSELLAENGAYRVFAFADANPPMLVSASLSTPLLPVDRTLEVVVRLVDELTGIATVSAELVMGQDFVEWYEDNYDVEVENDTLVVGRREIISAGSRDYELSIQLGVDNEHREILDSYLREVREGGYEPYAVIIKAEDYRGNLLEVDVNRALDGKPYSVMMSASVGALSIEETYPAVGAERVGSDETIMVKFSHDIIRSGSPSDNVELLKWTGENWNTVSVIESVYIGDTYLSIDLSNLEIPDFTWEDGQWYAIGIPGPFVLPQDSLDVSDLLTEYVRLPFRIDTDAPGELSIELRDWYSDPLGFWLQGDGEGGYVNPGNVYINERSQDEYWLWVQYGERAPRIMRSSEKIPLLPTNIKIWPVGVDPDETPSSVAEKALGTVYPPRGFPVLEGRAVDIPLKAANVPEDTECEIVYSTHDDDYDGQGAKASIEKGFLTIPIPSLSFDEDGSLLGYVELDVYLDDDKLGLSHFVRVFKGTGTPAISVEGPFISR